jgi:2-oxoisovalerate dehydrogenase E1 component
MVEPDKDYIIPLGKANIILQADAGAIKRGESVCVITYGMGVYWAKAAAELHPGKVEVLDLRSLYPLDEEAIYDCTRKHGKVLVLTEEQQNNSFAEALSSRSNGRQKSASSPVKRGFGSCNVTNRTKSCRPY